MSLKIGKKMTAFALLLLVVAWMDVGCDCQIIVHQPGGQMVGGFFGDILGGGSGGPNNKFHADQQTEQSSSEQQKSSTDDTNPFLMDDSSLVDSLRLGNANPIGCSLNKIFPSVAANFYRLSAWSSDVPRLTWMCTILASLSLVLCGILPAVLIPLCGHNFAASLQQSQYAKRRLQYLLCFAIGSLLADVFLHLLPETWEQYGVDKTGGLWVIVGLIFCLMVEKLVATTEESQRQTTAALNLLANVLDNTTHGLAIGTAFLVSNRTGFLTTFAILLHEIPHEISDFAILLNANFNVWTAIKAQSLTALSGVLGAVIALLAGGGGTGPSWLIPFTAGGFINIALVQLLPEIMEERNPKESLRQLIFILLGMGVMGFFLNCHMH